MESLSTSPAAFSPCLPRPVYMAYPTATHFMSARKCRIWTVYSAYRSTFWELPYRWHVCQLYTNYSKQGIANMYTAWFNRSNANQRWWDSISYPEIDRLFVKPFVVRTIRRNPHGRFALPLQQTAMRKEKLNARISYIFRFAERQARELNPLSFYRPQFSRLFPTVGVLGLTNSATSRIRILDWVLHLRGSFSSLPHDYAAICLFQNTFLSVNWSGLYFYFRFYTIKIKFFLNRQWLDWMPRP